jgi:hypothetical protein
MNQLCKSLGLFLTSALLAHSSHAQTAASNVRFHTDLTARKVIIEYELAQIMPNDSIYVELETASGRILRPLSINGDVGTAVKVGKDKLIAWDAVKDNVRINEDVKVLLRVSRSVSPTSSATTTAPSTKPASTPTTSRPTPTREAAPVSVVRKSSPIPIIGWVVTGGLAGYATVLALGLNKDVDEYNSKPFADDAADLQRFNDLKKRIDSRKSTFTIVAGAAAAVAVANVIYTIVNKNKSTRTSLLIQPDTRVTSVGLIRRF